MTSTTKRQFLWGGDHPWPVDRSGKTAQCLSFRAVDDRVRGGSSTSHLLVHSTGQYATFSGHLDTSTLGGAGFASQMTVENLDFDLSASLAPYDGLELVLGWAGQTNWGKGDRSQKYVLLVKDSIEKRRPDGRMESGINWESVFEARRGAVIRIPWKAFKATYRGRDIEPEEGLKTKEIKKVGLMMRSFFDQQSGDFKLPIVSIAAVKFSSSESEDEQPALAEGMKVEKVRTSGTDESGSSEDMKNHAFTDEELKEQKKAEKKAERKQRTEDRNARTGIGALTGEMRDRGEGGQSGWRGWFNWIGRC